MQSDEDQEVLKQVAECLLKYLTLHGGTGRNFAVLQVLAEGTLNRLRDGKKAIFNNGYLHYKVGNI